jgi:hypothetical protein
LLAVLRVLLGYGLRKRCATSTSVSVWTNRRTAPAWSAFFCSASKEPPARRRTDRCYRRRAAARRRSARPPASPASVAARVSCGPPVGAPPCADSAHAGATQPGPRSTRPVLTRRPVAGKHQSSSQTDGASLSHPDEVVGKFTGNGRHYAESTESRGLSGTAPSTTGDCCSPSPTSRFRHSILRQPRTIWATQLTRSALLLRRLSGHPGSVLGCRACSPRIRSACSGADSAPSNAIDSTAAPAFGRLCFGDQA